MDSFFSKSGDNKNIGSKIETPNVKKRHRRAKSGGLKNIDPSQLDGMWNSAFFENYFSQPLMLLSYKTKEGFSSQ